MHELNFILLCIRLPNTYTLYVYHSRIISGLLNNFTLDLYSIIYPSHIFKVHNYDIFIFIES